MESRPDPGGVALADEAMQRAAGSYALQAAIAAAHFRAEHAKDMDWQQIVRLYDALERLQPSPIVSLNRAVAVAMAEGPERGLRVVDGLVEEGTPDGTICFTPPARSLCARLGAKEGHRELSTRTLARDEHERDPLPERTLEHCRKRA